MAAGWPNPAAFAAVRDRSTTLVLAMILAGIVVRLVLAVSIGLENDGAYSAVLARTPAWGYFDHPPMHYWMVRLSTGLFRTEAPVLVRLPFILMFAGTTWLMFRITQLAFGDAAGLWAAAALNLSSGFSFAHAMFVAPDGPLMFFLLVVARLLVPLLLQEPRASHPNLRWAAAGVAAGLAMLSKYSALISVSALFVFLLSTRTGRKQIATPGPWIAILLCAAVFSPVIAWNSAHGWISFAFQGGRALATNYPGVPGILSNFLGQLGYLLPWVFAALGFALVRALLQGPARERSWFFACLAGGPILLFTGVSAGTRALPHWTMPGWLFAFPLLGREIAQLSERWRRALRALSIGGAAVLVGLVGVIALSSRGTLLESAFTALKLRRDPMLEVLDWTDLTRALRARQLLSGNTKFVAIFGSWGDAGRIAYALGPDVPTLFLSDDPRSRHFGNPRAFVGADGLIVYRAGSAPPLDATFDGHEPVASVAIRRGRYVAAELLVERGAGLKPFPPRSAFARGPSE